MNAGGTSPRMGEGTTLGMEEVELCREQQSRTMQKQLSRVMHGAITERARRLKVFSSLAEYCRAYSDHG